MAIGQDLRTYLLTKSAVTSVVGTRIFPGYMPEKNLIYPAIIYSVVSRASDMQLRQAGAHAVTRIQLDVYSQSALTRDSLAETLRNELQGFPSATTTMGNSSVTGVWLADE